MNGRLAFNFNLYRNSTKNWGKYTKQTLGVTLSVYYIGIVYVLYMYVV